MAKLSARGRTELVRMEYEGADGKYTLALMSDGVVLQKMSWQGNMGKMQCGGWKTKTSLQGWRQAPTPEAVARWKETYRGLGYKEVQK